MSFDWGAPDVNWDASFLNLPCPQSAVVTQLTSPSHIHLLPRVIFIWGGRGYGEESKKTRVDGGRRSQSERPRKEENTRQQDRKVFKATTWGNSAKSIFARRILRFSRLILTRLGRTASAHTQVRGVDY